MQAASATSPPLAACRNLVGLGPHRTCRRGWRRFGAEPFSGRAQLWHWIYHRGVTDFAGNDLVVQGVPRSACGNRTSCAGQSCRGTLASIDGTRQVAAAVSRWTGGRDRSHPRGGPRHVVRLLAGRLHAKPARSAITGTQRLVRNSGGGGDRGSGHDRAAMRSANGRRHRRIASWTNPRSDGDGRAAV